MLSTDVIVIGAGLAGMTAACSASEQGVRVVLVDRGGIGMGTNSAMSNGRFAGPTAVYGKERFIRDTLHTGRGINSKQMVSRMADEAPAAFEFLRSIGLELQVFSDHYFFKSPRSDVMRGASLTRQMALHLRTAERIQCLTGYYVTRILRSEEGIVGVEGFDGKGRSLSIAAPSVVLATGGGGAVYLRNDNQKSMMGQGYHLAARAGLELWDMEFVQFYPIVFAESRIPALMIYPPYPPQLKLLNSAGEDVIVKYGDSNLNDAMRKKRDRFSEIIFSESLAGPVKLDFREAPSESWNEYPLAMLKKIKFDFRNKPIAVLPGAHFFMGGVRIDADACTDAAGLFACGEAVWGVHGANRMSGNALTECIVFGRIAGRSAAIRALGRRAPVSLPAVCGSDGGSETSGEANLRDLQRQLREIAWRCAGIIRDGDGMRSGLIEVEAVRKAIGRCVPKNMAEKRGQADLIGAGFVLKAVLTAGLGRKETRGAFIRREFYEADTGEWRRNSCLRYDPETDSFAVSYRSAS